MLFINLFSLLYRISTALKWSMYSVSRGDISHPCFILALKWKTVNVSSLINDV